MPTGYTCRIIDDNYNFKQFAMLCARAFGACVELRDEPLDAPIPEEFKPSEYHVKALADAKAELAGLTAMSDEVRLAFGESKKAEAIASFESYAAKEKQDSARLLAVKADAERWTPPSPEHQELKKFMLDQIEMSVSDGGYWDNEIEQAKAKPAMDYYKEVLSAATNGIEYHTEQQEQEKELQSGRTQWVKDLRQSINDFN